MILVKEIFTESCVDLIPALTKVSQKDKAKLVGLIFKALTGTLMSHKTAYEEYALPNTLLVQHFGCTKRFRRMNDQFGIFEFSPHYNWKEGICKSVRLRESLRSALWKKLFDSIDARSYLLDSSGQRISTPPNAILSKCANGNTRITRVQLESSMVPIDRDAVKQFMSELYGELRAVQAGESSGIPRIRNDNLHQQHSWISRAILQCVGILYNSSLLGLPDSHLLQQYQESTSGRLHGLGFHLQNVVRDVRSAALNMCWDHDIVACHYSLVYEIAKKQGYEAKAIKEYIEDKSTLHDRLDKKYCIPAATTKTCMLALLYGGHLSSSPYSTLTKELSDTVKAFIDDEDIKHLHADTKRCMKFVIQDGNVSRGKLKNTLGKYVPCSKKRSSLAAHILHGYETEALELAVKQQDGKVNLLCHDGFVTEAEIDTDSIVKAFNESTGLNISYKSEKIELLETKEAELLKRAA